MLITSGTDTYGRVKKISGTPIVTKFAMLQSLPVFPLVSYYFIGLGPTQVTGFPLLGGSEYTPIIGIPLKSVDKTSVLMAYARALFALLTLIGFMSLFPIIQYFNEGQLDGFALRATRLLLLSFIVGVAGGGLSYVVPLTSRRERDIRRFCAEGLGVSADPARVSSDVALKLLESVGDDLWWSEDPRKQLIRQLIESRVEISRASVVEDWEAKTDELLDSLRQLERTQ